MSTKNSCSYSPVHRSIDSSIPALHRSIQGCHGLLMVTGFVSRVENFHNTPEFIELSRRHGLSNPRGGAPERNR